MSKVARLGLMAAALLVLGQAAASDAETLQWYRGNTHAHTRNSDGDSTPDTVARWYREHGYQFLFITDHDYLTDVGPLNALLGATEQFLILPGEEVTQWSDDPTRKAARHSDVLGALAHVNALFAQRLILPIGERKCPRRACGGSPPASMPIGATFKPNIDAIQAQGAIAQIDHPNGLWSLEPTDLAEVPDGVLIEVWNASDPFNLGGDDGSGDVRPASEGFWDWLLSRGKIVWGVGADDSHHYKSSEYVDPVKTVPGPALPGRAWIMVRAAASLLVLANPLRIDGDFPEMLVGILEVAGIAASERVLRRLRTGAAGLLHHLVDLGLGGDVVADGEVGGARCGDRDGGRREQCSAAAVARA